MTTLFIFIATWEPYFFIGWFIIGFIFSILSLIFLTNKVMDNKIIIPRIFVWVVLGTIGGLLTLGTFFDELHKKKTGIKI
jgi:fluoride ion exporter CrcB/FEX